MTEDANSTGWCEGEQKGTITTRIPDPLLSHQADQVHEKDIRRNYFMAVTTPAAEIPRVRVVAGEPAKAHIVDIPI